MIEQGDLAAAWAMLERSMRLCLSEPTRITARPLFGAVAVLLLRGGDASVPLGQLKKLFADGIEHVPWVVTAMLDALERKLPGDSMGLMRAVSEAIDHKERLGRLEENPVWREVKAVSFDARWPAPELSRG
jgi:hypothetical protein